MEVIIIQIFSVIQHAAREEWKNKIWVVQAPTGCFPESLSPTHVGNIIGTTISRICTMLLAPLVVRPWKYQNIPGNTCLETFMSIERLGITTCVVSVVLILDL